ncbi:MAG TPA: diacylglycerol kinase family protein [Vitreimonas sp.]|nr:diacylglycerol kinase family protein [Vitreimonas sp.]
MLKRVHLIINPVSGPDIPVLKLINQTLRKTKIEWHALVTRKASDIKKYVEKAIEDKVDAVAVYGGDGTLVEAATALAHQPIPLIILPGGTANIMAKELGVPLDLATALKIFTKQRHREVEIDLGKCGDELFALRMNVGLPADQVKGASRQRKNNYGNLAYALAAVEHWMHHQPSEYRMVLDGKKVTAQGVGLMVTNAGNFGLPGMSMMPNIKVTDGKLDVILIQSADLTALLSMISSTLTQATSTPTLKHWQVKTATIDVKPPQTIVKDDKVVPHHTLEISVVPKAVKILR